MRNALSISVTLMCIFIFAALLRTSQPDAAQAQEEAPQPPPVKTEIRTYDIRELLDAIPQFGNAIPPQPQPIWREPPSPFEMSVNGFDEDEPGCVGRVTAIKYLIKNMVSRDAWVPVGLTNSMEELNGTLFVSAPASDHEKIEKLLAQLSEHRYRMISVQWQTFEISSEQLHDLKQRLAGGGLILSAKNAATLTDELETGKLKVTSVASARQVCMNGQRTWVGPGEKIEAGDKKDMKAPTESVARFAIEPTMMTNHESVRCTTVVAIVAKPGDGDAAAQTCNFQSTVVIPDDGGVLMTASSGKTAQAGREIVVFLQVGVVKPVQAGADPRNAPR